MSVAAAVAREQLKEEKSKGVRGCSPEKKTGLTGGDRQGKKEGEGCEDMEEENVMDPFNLIRCRERVDRPTRTQCVSLFLCVSASINSMPYAASALYWS